MSFQHTHITAPDWRSAADQALANLEPGDSQLAFIYASHQFAEHGEQLVQYLRNHSPIQHWVGSVGLGIVSNGLETYDEPALAIMTTDLTQDQFRVMPNSNEPFDTFLKETKAWREQNLAYFAVVHGDPMENTTPGLITNLAEGLEGGFLVGGLTSSETDQVQFADHASSEGLSGVLFASSVTVTTGLSQGCSLIGSKHEISKCQRNIIIELDERPALDVFKEDIGETLARDLTKVGGYIFAALPIPGSDTGDYLVRNLVGIDPEQNLIAIGDTVEPGQQLQFAKRDAQTAHEDLERMLNDVKSRLPSPAKGALYHSCLGRGRHLFGEHSEEMKLVGQILGEDVPLVGFYANGEISHHRLYGYTGVLTVFS